jgi:hypothetical protein
MLTHGAGQVFLGAVRTGAAGLLATAVLVLMFAVVKETIPSPPALRPQ